jgi:hypothetical protein
MQCPGATSATAVAAQNTGAPLVMDKFNAVGGLPDCNRTNALCAAFFHAA